MLMSELITAIKAKGIDVTESRIRWAIKSGRIPRPHQNAAHHFNFSADDVSRAVQFFGIKQRAEREAAALCP